MSCPVLHDQIRMSSYFHSDKKLKLLKFKFFQSKLEGYEAINNNLNLRYLTALILYLEQALNFSIKPRFNAKIKK